MSAHKSLLNAFPWRVAGGPLRGTRCRITSTGDGVLAKLAGTYEEEIYPALADAVARCPAVVVDIGAAEGFYVSGLARAVPGARVIAYEAKAEWQGRIRHLAGLNGVAERCEIRGFCDSAEFRRLLESELGRSMFLLMDIEGGEFNLLTPTTVPMLSDAELLVELHEPAERSAGDALALMLGASHDVEMIWAREVRVPREVSSPAWRIAATLLPPVRRRLQEGRAYRMRWLHAVPRATPLGR